MHDLKILIFNTTYIVIFQTTLFLIQCYTTARDFHGPRCYFYCTRPLVSNEKKKKDQQDELELYDHPHPHLHPCYISLTKHVPKKEKVAHIYMEDIFGIHKIMQRILKFGEVSRSSGPIK